MTDETHVHQEEAPIEQSSEEVIAALLVERDEAIDRWKRTAADFDNFRKRAARERAELTSRSRTSGS